MVDHVIILIYDSAGMYIVLVLISCLGLNSLNKTEIVHVHLVNDQWVILILSAGKNTRQSTVFCTCQATLPGRLILNFAELLHAKLM